VNGERFNPDLLDEEDPFEIGTQVAHLFKHPYLGIDDIDDVWASSPLFYPARPPAHWLMCAEVGGRVLMVPLAPAGRGTHDGAARSAAMRLRKRLPPSIGRTADDHADDA
jgi:hypothetical protein